MMRIYMAVTGQFTFGLNIYFPEKILIYIKTDGQVAIEDNLAPMHSPTVDCAAVVKNYTFEIFNIFHL